MNKNILENYNCVIDPRWDHQILNYNLEKYNWAAWALDVVRELNSSIDSLEHVHLYFKLSELTGLRKHLEKWTNSCEFSSKLDSFFAEYISPLNDNVDYLIQATSGIRLVIPDQEKAGRLLSFHTGYWTGYSNDMHTVWTPLSRAFGTNTMQVISWEESIKIMEKIHNEKMSLEDLQQVCEQHMYPVEIDVGQSWLFNQGHLHGNVNNTTGISRMSFDARWARRGGNFGPRRAGSFFRFPGQFSIIDKNKINRDKHWIVFVDQNSEFVGNTPHYMIREFLMNLAKQLDITVGEWSNEYWGCTWMPKLQNFTNMTNIAGLVLPSVHAFSGSIASRLEMFHTAVDNQQQLIFADENFLVSTHHHIELIKKIYES
jgi:sporadic carbohydrate cluster 2OG-Fe(II) oxygenase